MTTQRYFAYCRVSTNEQNAENQIIAIRGQGYQILENRVISEIISGGVLAEDRPLFSNLIHNRMESGDVLVVLKLDRLGRNQIDVISTIQKLSDMGIRVISLDLGNTDLTSPAGKILVGVLSAVAEMERDRIRERTREGLERVKESGKKLGRPVASKTYSKIQELKQNGYSQTRIAREMEISIRTVSRHWK